MSVVLKFGDAHSAGKAIAKIRAAGLNLEVSPMKEGFVGHNYDFDQVVVIGNIGEIRSVLKSAIGPHWNDYVIRGEIDNKKES